jgi:hypothetical protein
MVESGAHRGLTARATTDQPRLSLVGFLRHHAQTQFRQISGFPLRVMNHVWRAVKS